MKHSKEQVTALLVDWSNGNQKARDQLIPVVYDELYRLARGYFIREPAGHTLQPTALINELFLKLADQQKINWRNRAQFVGVAAQLMRRILVDHARARVAAKRGGNAYRITTIGDAGASMRNEVDVITLNRALEKLAKLDAQQTKVVELRYFGGLTIHETAAAMEISVATVKREWSSARAWLWTEMTPTPTPS